MKRQRKVENLSQLVESLVADSADVILLFVDLCGSTQYKQTIIAQGHPDLTWIFRQLIFLQRAATLVKKYEGIVVKTIGDELFAYFEATTNPADVLKCAIDILQGFKNLESYRGNAKIEAKASIDIGLTYNGSIVNSVAYDPIGTAVDRCARLNSIAKNNEIVFSEDFKAATQGKIPYTYKQSTKTLKGIGKTKYFTIVAK